MSGYKSSRWRGHTPKTMVEECSVVVDVGELKVELPLLFQGRSSGVEIIRPVYHQGWKTLRIVALPGWRGGVVVYLYLRPGTMSETVSLQSTHLHYGGLRWWFVCPSPQCTRRVRKLYCPPAAGWFACRTCWPLAYTSQRENRIFRTLRKLERLKNRLGVHGDDTAAIAPIPPDWGTVEIKQG